MKKILLILVGLSSLSFADFSRSGDIVIDNTTKLQWQDNNATGNNDMKWQEAIDYCENTLTLGGHNDWRLPNKKELLSIVDYSRYNPSIDNQFQNTISYHHYWSSTTHANDTSAVRAVRFYYGYTRNYGKGYNGYVRCVRSGQ